MIEMTLQEAINIRTSRRTYIEAPLEQEQIEKLQKLIDEYNKIGGFRIELVMNNGEAFKGFTSSYGLLTGVNHYLGFIVEEDAPDIDEKIGYYGELIILHLTIMRLGTCWIGGSFRKSKTPFKLDTNERLACLITVGKVEDEPRGREAFIYKLIHRKTKGISEMFRSDGAEPTWFLSGMEAVAKAPSALNKQPVMFHYENGRVTAAINSKIKYVPGLDLGIAKLHFELGAGGGTWKWGNGGEFVYAEERH